MTLLKGLLVILVLALLGVMTFSLYEERRFIFRSRAYVNTISADNIYCFSTPACSKADNQQINRVYCFCLDTRGIGISGAIMKLSPASDVSVRAVQAETDGAGKSIFDITSLNPGEHPLQVSCNDTVMKEPFNVCFQQ